MAEEQKRIDFVDLTKGICIILVIASHIGGSFDVLDEHSFVPSFRMPLYFFISGIFFKSYEGLFSFFIHKVNRLIIPFCFFYFTTFGAQYLLSKLVPGSFQLPVQLQELLVVFDAHKLIDFNPPIWFLIALFNCNLLFYLVHFLRQHHLAWMFIVATIIGVIGFYLGKQRIELPFYIDVAMTALPFYVGGFWIRRYNFFLQPHRFDRFIPLFILMGVCGIFLFATPVGMRTNSYAGHIWQFYLAGFSGILMIMLLCKRIKRVPFISYIGKYSVIALGIHAPILHFGFRILPRFIGQEWLMDVILLLITLLIAAITTPIFLKLFPRFVAQKDFIRIKMGYDKQHAL